MHINWPEKQCCLTAHLDKNITKLRRGFFKKCCGVTVQHCSPGSCAEDFIVFYLIVSRITGEDYTHLHEHQAP